MSPEPITPNALRDWPLPEPGAGKYGRGQVLVIGGAARTPGGSDALAVQVGPLGYLASELLTEIPRVLVELGG